jgi:hypothetical protein
MPGEALELRSSGHDERCWCDQRGISPIPLPSLTRM